ncbi:uncharacterized protein LOC144282226 isoform X2 [Canis aureus]
MFVNSGRENSPPFAADFCLRKKSMDYLLKRKSFFTAKFQGTRRHEHEQRELSVCSTLLVAYLPMRGPMSTTIWWKFGVEVQCKSKQGTSSA